MKLSSRERLLKAFNCQKPDYIPCAFMLFNALRARYDNDFDFFRKQMELGLDAIVYIPLIERKKGETTDFETMITIPYRPNPRVKINEWIDKNDPGERYPILNKEYITPEGSLKMEVRETPDWIFGDRVALLSDWNTPRSKKYLIRTKEDIKKLKYLLTSLTDEEIKNFREKSKKALDFAKNNDLLTGGMWGLGVEASAWLTGIEFMIMQTIDDPDFVMEFADFFEKWNRDRMEIFLNEGIDLFIRRGWYEGVDFWTPENFKKYIFPSLKREADLCHQAGTKFAYAMAKGSLPLIDQILDAGVDILQCIDPVMDPYMDLKKLKVIGNNKISVWGGVNEPITVQSGSEEKIRKAVKEAIITLDSNGGLVLSPVENVLLTTNKAWENVLLFIKVWKEMRNIV